MKRYAILRYQPAPLQDETEGFKRPAEPIDQLSLTVERIPEKAVLELAADPQVSMIAPLMPTQLVMPLDAEPVGNNWGISAVGADRSPYTGAGVTIAVLDTGIDREHPAFSGLRLTERDFTREGNGDQQGHGTHCAGILCGDMAGQRIGVAQGVNRLLVGKLLGKDGTGQSHMLFEALLWAMREHADIITLSIGFGFPEMINQLEAKGWPTEVAIATALEAYRGNLRMFDAIMHVLKAQAVYDASPLVITAAGNESRRDIAPDCRIGASLPPTTDNVVSVAAVGQYGETLRVADFSNSMPLAAAPGVGIRSAWPGGALITLSGTSMACQSAAGVAALWWEALYRSGAQPNAATVKARLLASARIGVFGQGLDAADIGHGLVTAPK